MAPCATGDEYRVDDPASCKTGLKDPVQLDPEVGHGTHTRAHDVRVLMVAPQSGSTNPLPDLVVPIVCDRDVRSISRRDPDASQGDVDGQEVREVKLVDNVRFSRDADGRGDQGNERSIVWIIGARSAARTSSASVQTRLASAARPLPWLRENPARPGAWDSRRDDSAGAVSSTCGMASLSPRRRMFVVSQSSSFPMDIRRAFSLPSAGQR